ncbi:conserved hypothetical protein [Bifidobacterium longum subsp. infantis ATCC 15697 = JCM 1222 = DSM 20088]|nr:conserved hypothetical protein [Bifidobacterium longum subsp. infantis ATCC 15697 = JCM 1222 = DSM 20088]
MIRRSSLSRDWRRPFRAVGWRNGQAADEQPADIVADIAADLKTGMTVPQIADYRRLPSDFVDMAVMRAQERGLVTLMDRAPRSLCDGTACRPDPASLVCAGCPFRAPSSARS